MQLPRKLRHDLAVDIGTSYCRISFYPAGIVVEQPTMVALKDGMIIALGNDAKKMQGKTPQEIRVERPLVKSSIADYEAAEYLLKSFIAEVRKKYPTILPRPDVLLALPPGLTSVERRALVEATIGAGASQVSLVDQALAICLGAGVAVKKTKPVVIIDIGGGTSKFAVVSRGKVSISGVYPSGVLDLVEAVQLQLREEHALQIGWPTSERIVAEVLVLHATQRGRRQWIVGKDTLSGLPKRMRINSDQLLESAQKTLRPVIDFLRAGLDELPNEVKLRIRQEGLLLAGGGSMLVGFEAMLADELKAVVRTVPNPLTACVEGAGRMQQDKRLYTDQMQSSVARRGIF